jgi:hypothetical protein
MHSCQALSDCWWGVAVSLSGEPLDQLGSVCSLDVPVRSELLQPPTATATMLEVLMPAGLPSLPNPSPLFLRNSRCWLCAETQSALHACVLSPEGISAHNRHA